tara:strand:- start:591 stop:1202 length:612 start_codon:yes stop_codon:yes gene_type:complete
MKIICVGRNYKKHILELKNKIPSDIIFFLKPETAIPLKNQPFFLPDFSEEIHHEIEVVVKIDKTGKHIQEKFAHNYYNEFTLGIDFTARDVQKKLKKNGEPWEKAKAFDGSAPIGKFIHKDDIKNIQNIDFQLTINKEKKQIGNTKHMIYTISQLISYISKFITLKKGDLIFTGTPSGVGKVKKGDFLEGFINNTRIIDVKIK